MRMLSLVLTSRTSGLVMAFFLPALAILSGCQTPPKSTTPLEAIRAENEDHIRRFSDFSFQKLGSVENTGLQIPVVSPDGTQLLYLRSDAAALPPLTLLGSGDPKDTPETGRLSIWRRPVTGSGPGRELSPHRWSHSPTWSHSGTAVVYVTNTPPSSAIIHTDLVSGRQTVLGVTGMVNCLPRFTPDDRAVLFCAGTDSKGPFRIYRQSPTDKNPVPVTLPGIDALFPLTIDDGKGVICARTDGERIRWTDAHRNGFRDLTGPCGYATRPAMLQTLAGIAEPVAPDRASIAFYDALQNRVCVYHRAGNILRAHHSDSISACWLTNKALAMATGEWLFVVNTATGMSLQIFNGEWIPARYVPGSRKLILLGRETSQRFSIMEIRFTDRKAK